MLIMRLKCVMGSLVFEGQNAFVSGRLITDIILIAFEIQHYLKRKRKWKVGLAALKIDMTKAYDRL